MATGRKRVRHPGSTDRGGRRMLTSHPSPGPDEPGGGPVLRRAAPMTSIQQFESPDAAEAHFMADQRAADQRPPEPTQMSNRPAQDRPTQDRPDRTGREGVEARPTRGTDRVRPAAPSGVAASGPAVADIQTTSGVPKVVIPVAVPAPAPAEGVPPGASDDAVPETPSADGPETEAVEVPGVADPGGPKQSTDASVETISAETDSTDDTFAEVEASADAEAKPDAKAEAKAEPDAKTEPDAKIATEAEPGADTKSATGHSTAAAIETEPASAAEAAVESGFAPEAEATPKAEAGARPEATAALEARAEDGHKVATATDSRIVRGTDIEQVKGEKADTEADVESQADVQVEPDSEREAQPEADGEAAAEIGTTPVDRPPTETPEGTESAETGAGAPADHEAEPADDGPGLDDTVVLTLPETTTPKPTGQEAPEEQAPGEDDPEDTVVLVARAHDDTVVIPVITAGTVAPPTGVVTAVIPVVPGRRDGQRTRVAAAPDPGRKPKPARARREPLDLGHAPSVLAISALGVLMVALAYAGGRVSTGNAQFAYWVGQVVVFTPVVVRLLSRRMAGVAESFVLVMGLALHQYLLKWMYSPDQFRFPDELQHWLATTVIVQSGELFRPNPALPPAEHFPGLAELGAAVAEMTGLPVTAAGVVVAGVAHLVFVGVLFAVVLRASNSPAVAGVACATYATALHYLFFNSMFLYQTAALPFFMLTIWAVRRWRAEGGRAFVVLAAAAMALTTVSHHVTALALVATLLLLAVAELVVDRPRRWSALVMPATAGVVVAAWILLVATDVLGYLEEPVDQVRRTVSQLLSGKSDPASATAPVSLGQLAVQGAGLLGLLVLYLAVTRDMLHRRDRDWWRWAAVAGGLVFFAGNGVRFLGQNGPEIAGRLSTFTYIPISILAAIGLVRGVQLIPARDADGHRWRAAAPAIDVMMPGGWNLYSRVAAGAAMITLLMIGARAGGWPPIASILPGPYLAGGYERSVDAYGVTSADWQRTALGPGNRVGGDATSVSLASTYGRQDPVREVGPLYYADVWGLEQDDLVQRLHVAYLVVDRRLSTQLPESGAYFESDPRSGQITSPLTVGQLGKFDTLAGFDRLYDNGNVRIYRTGAQ